MDIKELAEQGTRLRMLQCQGQAFSPIFHLYNKKIEDIAGKECIFYEYRYDSRNLAYSRKLKSLVEDVEDYGFEVKDRWFNDPEEEWQYILDMFQYEVPAVVRVDDYYIPYTPSFMQGHHPHFVCVVDYCAEEDQVVVHDPSFRVYDTKIPGESFRKAMYHPDYESEVIHVFNTEIQSEVAYQKLIAHLEYNLTQMLHPDPDIIYQRTSRKPMARENQHFKVGLKGIYELSEGEDEFLAREQMANEYLTKYGYMFYVVAEVAEQTELHAKYLQNKAQEYNLSGLLELSHNLDYIAQNWLIVKNMFFKASLRDAENMVTRAFNKVKAIAEQEERYLMDLSQLLQSLR